MGTPGDEESDFHLNYRSENGCNEHTHLQHENMTNNDNNLDDYQLVSKHSRKRRNDQNGQEAASNTIHTPQNVKLQIRIETFLTNNETIKELQQLHHHLILIIIGLLTNKHLNHLHANKHLSHLHTNKYMNHIVENNISVIHFHLFVLR